MTLEEADIEQKLIAKLDELKYSVRPDIRDKAALEHNFRQKLEALNQVQLTNAEFARLRDEIISADAFLAKCSLAQMISRYMVLVASEQKLLIMRPYQIYAVKAIIDCIHQYRGNGYIWHTTGSGKTLTSFKAATLLKDNPDIEKCLFVVDRKEPHVRKEIGSHSAGSTRYNIGQETLSVIAVLIPNLPEQRNIASCLSSIDNLITAQTEKLDALKTHKKGLMQQLFPSPEAVAA